MNTHLGRWLTTTLLSVTAISPAMAESTKAQSLNFYGLPGVIDTPTADMQPDAQFTLSLAHFADQTRYNLTFQPTPWATATFRYKGIKDLTPSFSTYYDRSFDVRFQLLKERKYLPSVTVGLQDFVGTGIYAGEYVVATKNFATPALRDGRAAGNLKLSAGLGWGRLGSYGAIGSTGGTRPAFVPGSTGGQVAYDQWFRGDVAPFAGVEWQLDERWGLKAEYSSDAYIAETVNANVFERKSPLNFGVEYQASEGVRLGAYYLYGSEIGVSAQFQLNPKRPATALRIPSPIPVAPRTEWATDPALWTQDWSASEAKTLQIKDVVAQALAQDGLKLEAIVLTGTSAEVRYRNAKYRSYALSNGRVARAMARSLPPSVEQFRIVPVQNGLALSALELNRSDLERLEYAPNASGAMAAASTYSAAGALPANAITHEEQYPAWGLSLGPYASPSYFDPAQPFRLDVGLEVNGQYEFAPGWKVKGAIRHRLAGNVKNGRASNSVLQRVRTDQNLYAQFDTTLENLYVSRHWNLGGDFYGRATVGYLESMYGGASAEVLWKPVDSPFAFGIEGNYVKQRDFNQRFGFQDYSTFTGHASAYYETNNGFLIQVDAGRYLAGDYGATVGVDRVFKNGWSVGGFFTKTNVSAADFGEGSFDKGIRFNIPLDWAIGKPTRSSNGMTIRPTQRDGGQRVKVSDRLYEQIRDAHHKSLEAQSARFWE